MDEQQNDELLLSAEERAGCKQVAAGEPPYSQRAQAILALADGASLADAAAQTGLTENQLKLWRGRFRNGRLAIFPEELLIIENDTATMPETAPEATPKKEKKAKKEKKKKKDGDKKKKDKKGKKGKKSKGKKEKKTKSKKAKKK
jgi:hypothetical protein